MTDYMDIYCERLEPGLWAEPLNALTNIAFFVAAFFAHMAAEGRGRLDWNSGILIFLLFCIGVGSTLFHTFATAFTMMLDVLPILFYQIAFIGIYSSCVMKLCWRKIAVLYSVFFILSVICEQIPTSVMNGSLSYAPSILFVFGFGVWHYNKAERERLILLGAACLFLVSITLRSIDMMVCSQITVGTHFLWHMLNGGVLYLTTRSYIVDAAKP